MIQLIDGLPEGTLGLSFHGQVSGDDYDTVLVPALDRAIDLHDRVRTLLRFGSDFEGYSLEAAWDDTLVGLRHWRGFERMAIVSDVPWLRTAIRAVAGLLPCPVRLFDEAEEQDARLWLAEALGTIHLHRNDGYLRVQLIGQVEPQAYDRIDRELETLFAATDRVRLLIDLTNFDGWSGLSALSDHLTLVREHRHIPERVAVLGDRKWQQLLQKLISRFTRAETRYFDRSHAEQAEIWLQQT